MCSHYTTYLSHHHNTASRRRQSINLSSSLVSMCLVIYCLTVRSKALRFTTKQPHAFRSLPIVVVLMFNPGRWTIYAVRIKICHKKTWEMAQSYLRWILNCRSMSWMLCRDRYKNCWARGKSRWYPGWWCCWSCWGSGAASMSVSVSVSSSPF